MQVYSLLILHIPLSLLILQSVAAGVGADLYSLHELYDANAAIGLQYMGNSPIFQNIKPKNPTEIDGKNANFASLDVSDKNELNAHLAFAALCLLREKEKREGNKSLYRAFSVLDVMSQGVQKGLQSRPPCRWETHNVTISVNIQTTPPVRNTNDQSDITVSDIQEVHVVSSERADNVIVQVVLDVGHNPAAMEALSDRIIDQFPGRGIR